MIMFHPSYNSVTLIVLFLIAMIFPGHAQEWKQYPYTPEGSVFSFPVDEGQHPDEDIEWWTITGSISGQQTGTKYSFSLSYYSYPFNGYDGIRILNLSNDDTGAFFSDRQYLGYSMMGLDFLNLRAYVYADERWEFWRHRKDSDKNLIPFEYEIFASCENGELDIKSISQKPPVFIGDNGLFDVGAESYTHNYSQTRNAVTGTIRFNDIEEEFEGTAWIDHQYGGFNMITAEKYEWFSIQLSNSIEINIWNVFTPENQLPNTSAFKHMTVVDPSNQHFTSTDFTLERLAFEFMEDHVRSYSQKWHLTSPENHLDLIISTLHSNNEVKSPFRFFKGVTGITGTVNESPVTGTGFAELLKTYAIPEITMNTPTNNCWDVNTPISWQLLNPDDGLTLLYDLEYRTKNSGNFQTVSDQISDTLIYWENPPVEAGDTIWFRVKGYSMDSTLSSYTPAVFCLPENQIDTLVGLNRQVTKFFRLYPNPARDILNIELHAANQSFRYKILDLSGKVVSQSDQKITGRRCALFIGDLPPGSYVLSISTKNDLSSAIFHIQK